MTNPPIQPPPSIPPNIPDPVFLSPKTVGFGQLWATSDWRPGSFRAKCLFGGVVLVLGGLLATHLFRSPRTSTTVAINPNQQANNQALQQSWTREYNALTDFTRSTVAAWDLSQQPDPKRMSLLQMAIENETLDAAQALQQRLTTPGNPCNIATIRHALACGEGVIQAEVLPEMSAAASSDSKFMLVEVDATTNKEIRRRVISNNEVMAANLIRWQALLRAGAEYPRREFPLNFASQSQLGTSYLDAIKGRLSQQGVVDYLSTQEAGKTYWQRMNGNGAVRGEPNEK
jgi:hypothetical protein